MNLKENGTNLSLETFKESVLKKHKKEKLTWYAKFILIFLTSHMLRTGLEPNSLQLEAPMRLRDGHLRIKLKAESFVANEQKRVNLFHKIKHIEISNVIIIQSNSNQYEIDVESKNISQILLNQEGWQIIPLRKLLKIKQRKSYEILL